MPRLLFIGFTITMAVSGAIDREIAAQYFAEAKKICGADAGALWGRSLCGPLVFVEPGTRGYVASDGDAGVLPSEYNIANTAFEWKGARWTMVRWPLPKDPARRASLLLHELWHRIQPDLGLSAPTSGNEHLAGVEGRVWMQLEWKALAAALSSSGEARAKAIGEAVAFRGKRRSLFPRAAAEEQTLEIAEGLAQYTGVRLSGAALKLALEGLTEHAAADSYVRSFAYASGPAWGLLLDDLAPKWRSRVTASTDLATLLPEQPACDDACIAAAAGRYGAAGLRAGEIRRSAEKQKIVDQYLAALVHGPVLTVPLMGGNFQFDPGNVVPLGEHGTVYPGARVSAEWGTLQVLEGGALISQDFARVTVPASATAYKLELKPGWVKVPGERLGSFRIERARE